MTAGLRKTGIPAVGDMPWGTHFCHFYQTRKDLLDIVLPYLRAGLENNELCLWVTAEPLGQATRKGLRRTVPGADGYLAEGDIEIFPYSQWYLKDGTFDGRRVIDAWERKLAEALARGYAGLRVAADEAWLGKKYWQAFSDYEKELNERLADQPLIVQCAYPLATNDAAAIFDVAHTHQFAIAERNGHWETLETPELKQAKAALKRLNEALEDRVIERTQALATNNAALRRENAQRRLMEEALRASQQQLQAIIDNTTAIIYVKDPEGRYLLINRRYEKLFHVSREAVVGKTDFDFFPPEQAAAFRAVDRQVLAAGTALEAEEVASQDDGLHTYLSIKCPLFDASGRPYAVCGISTDITERKQAEAEHQAREAAEAASRAKSTFLASMSHELRTPLNGILGYAQILRRDKSLDERQITGLNVIQQSGEHLLTLINDILDFAKIEAGKLELCLTDLPLARFLQTIAEMITIKATEKHLDMICDLAPDLPPEVRADERRLRQVLLNLLSNAVKFTDRGQVSLRVSFAPPARLRFEVRDTGIGIGADQLGALFQPFVQVGEAQRRLGGTGLGLAISRQFVRLMGGDIQVESRVGQGSIFWFELELPVAQAELAAPSVEGVVTGYEGPRKKVLVVDDVAENRAVVVDFLSQLGFEMIEAVNGSEGLEKARTWQPDLILIDIVMPGIDGLEATRRLRRLPAFQAVPIIAISASAASGDEEKTLAAGMNAFLPKPVDCDRLLSQIAALLQLRWIYEAPAAAPEPPATGPLVAPPMPEMEALHRLARLGNMQQILQWSSRQAELDGRYRPFADQLDRLARGYQSQAILRLVERYLEKRTGT